MIDDILSEARRAQRAAPPVGDPAYRSFIRAVRERIGRHWRRIAEANARDLDRARERGLPVALLERLRLTDRQRSALEGACDTIERDMPRSAYAPGETSGEGAVRARRMLRPLGVVLMIFEARAEITLRSAAMCGATGNAVLLRGGAEIAETNTEVGKLLSHALADAGLPGGLVTVLDSSDRSQLRALLRRDDAIDVLIPRGGPSLIELCRTASRIPLITSGGGANHLYVHHTADLRSAARVALDAKLGDPAACTALEMLLVDEQVLDPFLAELAEAAGAEEAESLRLRVPDDLAERLPAALASRMDDTRLGKHDNGREFLDTTLAVRPVPDLDAAVDHISRFGSGHTEGVVANAEAAGEFCARVDAAAVVVNGSLRLNDGPRMGLGPAPAISTGRLHARGPVTLGALLTHSWIVDGANTENLFETTGGQRKAHAR